jgi:hypothetical protein
MKTRFVGHFSRIAKFTLSNLNVNSQHANITLWMARRIRAVWRHKVYASPQTPKGKTLIQQRFNNHSENTGIKYTIVTAKSRKYLPNENQYVNCMTELNMPSHVLNMNKVTVACGTLHRRGVHSTHRPSFSIMSETVHGRSKSFWITGLLVFVHRSVV